jgi:hypothetical protein
MKKGITWPTIRATQADKGIMDAIKSHDGRLKLIDSKDLMMIAAALAVEYNLPYDSRIQDKMSDTISYANLNTPAYEEYRHFISAIYFMTKAEKKVENMKDVSDMVKNFEDYAHRGILYLKDKYLDEKEGDSELFMNFVELLSSRS